MLKAKRVVIATILGLIFGFVCMYLASTSPGKLPLVIAISIVLNRTLMGFGIGISGLRLAWWLHGLIMGLIFSLPMAFSAAVGGPPPEAASETAQAMSPIQLFIWTIILGIVYGFLIELFTSVVFKAKRAS
ncbi:MAG: hypothetical protein ONB05_10400 [candidate division KSB1 bacterium]|nr:hypothetical protein [candidate division KSB1 bacterium]